MNTTINEERRVVGPDFNPLRNNGWRVSSTIGPYCTAWKDCEDVLFIWKDGVWLRVH